MIKIQCSTNPNYRKIVTYYSCRKIRWHFFENFIRYQFEWTRGYKFDKYVWIVIDRENRYDFACVKTEEVESYH